MTYLVLARKYRPGNFSEMVGQEHVVKALESALLTQRLHHAYLFTGTRGVGKTTVSRILAKSLNCQGSDGNGGITAQPCGVCLACREIDGGRFVDYTELDAASNRGVDEIQSLLEQAVYKPVQGRFKVFMIDEVHMLTNTAFNAMLKTLEEPPSYLKFVLATTDPQKVPVTVLSRCLQFNLRPMAPGTIAVHLAEVLQREQVASDTAALQLLARAARGSMRDALSLTDQAIAFGAGSLRLDSVRQMLGNVDRTYVLRLLQSLARGDGKTLLETVEQLRLNGLSAGSALEEMAEVLQRLAVQQWAPSSVNATPEDTTGPDMDADPDAQVIAKLAQDMAPDETQLLYSLCLHGRADLGLAVDEYAALGMVLLRFLVFKPGSSCITQEKKTLDDAPLTRGDAGALTQASGQPQSPVRAAGAPTLQPKAHVDQESGLPPGRTLPVHTPDAPGIGQGHFEQKSISALVGIDSDATKIVAIAVRDPAPSPREEPKAPNPDASKWTDDGDFWHATVQALVDAEAITAVTRELALQSELVARDVGQWALRVERESLSQVQARERLTAALHKAGFAVTLAIEIGRVRDSPALRNAAAAAQRQLEAERTVFEDVFVQKLMREFGAKIVPGSIRPL